MFVALVAIRRSFSVVLEDYVYSANAKELVKILLKSFKFLCYFHDLDPHCSCMLFKLHLPRE